MVADFLLNPRTAHIGTPSGGDLGHPAYGIPSGSN
jgi:hypothetical protein